MPTRNKISIELSVDDKGTVHVKQFSEKASQQLKKLGDESDRITSRMGTGWARLKSSWLGVTAAITAAIYTMKKGWDELGLAARADQERRAFENLAASYGTSADTIIDELKRVSGQTIDTMTAIRTAGSAMMMGIAPEHVVRLMEVARATTRMTGQTISEAFRDISLGVARQSKMILDNLGIIIRIEEANRNYAKALGKTAEQLSDAEKKQAFMNATLKAGDDLMERLGEQTDTLHDKLARMKATLADARLGFQMWLADLLTRPNQLEQLQIRRLQVIDQLMTKENQLRELQAGARERLTIMPHEFAYTPSESGLFKDIEALEKELMRISKIMAELKKGPPSPFRAPEDLGLPPPPTGAAYEEEVKAAIKAAEEHIKTEAGRWEAIAQIRADHMTFMDELGQKSYEKEMTLFEEVMAEQDRACEHIEDKGVSTFDSLENAVTGWASTFSAELTDMLWTADRTFGDILESFGRMISQMAIQKAVIEPLLGAAFPEKTAARGAAFDQGRLLPYGRGGIVDQPTLFPMAGGAGLMGEKGPEAILPLSRTSGGDLGVKAETKSEAPKISINLINQSGYQLEAVQRGVRREFDARVIEVVLTELRRGKALRNMIKSTT